MISIYNIFHMNKISYLFFIEHVTRNKTIFAWPKYVKPNDKIITRLLNIDYTRADNPSGDYIIIIYKISYW